MKSHENHGELIMRLARTDFKLRYHGSTLGYVWAIVKPLLLFTILNFVFSSIFNFRNSGIPFYSLQLLTAILLFGFFSEGTVSGMTSLLSKSQLVTKTYVPRWTIVIASTLNALFVFGMNMIILAFFFIVYNKMPSLAGIGMFLIYVACLYALIVAFSFLTAPIFVRFRDLSMIWEVLLSIIMYSAPIIYPLSLIPAHLQKFLLLNPVGFIIHYTKEALILNSFPPPWQFVFLIGGIAFSGGAAFLVYCKLERKVAEYI